MLKRGNGSLRCGSSSAKGEQQPRRQFLRAALAAGVSLPFARTALAEDEKPGADQRPQPGDLFVHAEGDAEGKTVDPADIPLDGAPVQVWPMDPGTKVVRDGSRLNQVLLLRLDPASLDEDTREHSADGIVAFSAICSHAGCPV